MQKNIHWLQEKTRRENRDRILKSLSEGEKTFTELLKDVCLSKPVLLNHIKTLENGKKIKKAYSNGKIIIKITKRGRTDEELHTELFGDTSASCFAKTYTKDMYLNMERDDFLKYLPEKIGLFTFYSLIKQLSTGRDLSKSFSIFNDKFTLMLRRYIIYGLKTQNETIKMDTDKLFDDFGKNPDNFKNEFETIFNTLNNLYPEDISKLNEIWENPWELKGHWRTNVIEDMDSDTKEIIRYYPPSKASENKNIDEHKGGTI
ncbi:MAG: winged helix-turn-helix domain-containing protein [Thermoplasmata archaeon]